MAERPLPGDSIEINRRYLDRLLVEGRIVGAVHPTAETTLFGHLFQTPITTGALSHLKPGMDALALGAKEALRLSRTGREGALTYAQARERHGLRHDGVAHDVARALRFLEHAHRALLTCCQFHRPSPRPAGT